MQQKNFLIPAIERQRGIARHFSNAAHSYDAVASLQAAYIARAISVLAPSLAEDALLLDVGAGTAALARMAHAAQKKWRVCGVDLSSVMCQHAAAHQHATIRADMHALPIAKQQMDAAVCAFALQWAAYPKHAIAEIAATLKPHAPFIAASFTSQTLHELRQSIASAGLAPRVNDFHAADDYAAWCEAAGLKVQAVHSSEHVIHYPDAQELLKALKEMGATYSTAQSTAGRGLRGRRDIALMTASYEALFASGQGIPATWAVVFIEAKKHGPPPVRDNKH